ncbi:conserved hypothetical protein [Solidesulfovibrio fructosivorans JJ]]|uniref:DUF4142 domain-containing protein n=1 Tax=Solidesulfovibrio fructosivorans JJ] TaxID=596151 RepID=E1K1P9_SOLFR|nr:hypothetical protein [Solidesulfovibrio fructosivorans]EFL49487.1 conserved hypothetical protein [Solidesulfovibrio fructosivorans JJ]]
MPRLRFCAPLLAVFFLGLAVPAPGQQTADPSRDVFLQTIGMLAGQGLALGHESLQGIVVRYEKRVLPREEALRRLAAEARYADLVLAAFKERLMTRLAPQEQKDLSLLIGYYEIQRQAIEALAVYVRSSGAKNRQRFEELQKQVGEVLRRISLGGGAQ